ncbi:MAG: penicillin-binding protein 2 [Desulfatitalea sp.]|nr:penicillin-binding protein 2 [Desulfatitalea sp.]
MKSKQRHSLRAAIVGGLFFVWLAAIGVRAGYVQIHDGTWLSDQAAGRYEREVTLQGKRGTIYDRRHEAMAMSVETTSVAASPGLVTDKNQAATALARALRLDAKQILQRLNSGRSFVWIKRQAGPKEVSAVRELNLPGIGFLPEHSRFYPNGVLGAQVLGFTGIDGQGLEGLEFNYNTALQGAAATITVKRDARGRGFGTHAENTLPRAGQNLVLTIDRQVQYIAEQALADAVTEYQASSGMALVMIPQTGELLAMAHYPFFNPNAFGKSDRATWRNRAITDPFEPGSTLKIFSAAAAMENGISAPDTIYYCENGTYRLAGHTVNDTKPHGWLSLQQIVKYSSNIGAVKMVEQMGPGLLHATLKGFGFGVRTGIDCPGESPGSLADYRRWTVVDTGAIAFGQGVSVTAVQLLSAASAIANDGMLMRPYVVQAVLDANGQPVHTAAPEAIGQVVSAQTALSLRRIMHSVVTEGGTGVQANVAGYAVSGKTGTAQKIDRSGKYSPDQFIASFVGFAPTERPAIAVLVVVDEPRKGRYGGLVAAPVFSRIVKETLGYLDVPPSGDWKKLRVAVDAEVKG